MEFTDSEQESHLGRPVRETFLLSIHKLMWWSAWLTEPVFVCLLIGDTITITALPYLL
jgi:hypothetical protein